QYAFALDTTVAQELQTFAVAYRRVGDTGPFIVDTAVERRTETLAVWDARAVTPQSYDVEVRATDALGRVFVAPIRLAFTPRAATLDVCTQSGGLVPTLQMQLSQTEPAPELSNGGVVDVYVPGGLLPIASMQLIPGRPDTIGSTRVASF